MQEHLSSAIIALDCQAEANVNPRPVITQPLEDLGNALVSLFPVEMQYNIRGSCR